MSSTLSAPATQPFTLSAQQLAFFDCFGYLALPGLLADRAAQIIADFEAVWAAQGGGHNGKSHDGKQRSCLVPFVDQSPNLSALLDDERVLGVARGLLGDDFNYMGSDGNYYTGETGWHSDGWNPASSHRYIKLAFYLDPLDGNSGALRVMPGSHRKNDAYAAQLQKMLGQSAEQFGMPGAAMPGVVLDSKPGDLLVFNHAIKHASFNGASRRRMFTLNLAQRFPEEHIGELKDYIHVNARFWIERFYGERMVATAGPERMRHLAQGMAHDGQLAELSRQRRLEMAEPSRG